ncbi:MAG: glycosyltransferase family 61 protein [Alphaproteobacteria bacterium]|nr:glycosyltransferase family 61 protein [Alphaproteobacteria bacterium]
MDLRGVPHLEGRISDLIHTGQLDGRGIEHRKILKKEAFLPSRPLIPGTEPFCADWICQRHGTPRSETARPVRCYAIPDLRISGIGHVHVAGQMIVSAELIPGYWMRKLREDWAGMPAAERQRPVRRIEGRTIAFSGWGPKVYGHFLIEMLPRLLIAREFLGEEFATAQLLVPMPVAGWFEPMVAMALGGVHGPFVRYDPGSEQVELADGVLPEYPLQRTGFHPGLNPLIDRVRETVSGPVDTGLAPRLFVTRVLFSNPETGARRCLNELELAGIAAREFGFAVLAPETLPWPTQVKLMAGASVLAGAFGSGLHGSIFSGPGTRVATLGFHNLTQTMIADFRRQAMAYMTWEGDGPVGDFRIEEERFRRFLAAVVA